MIEPYDSEEAGHIAAVNALLASGGDLFDRRRFAPGHITASAFVVRREGGKALLIFHQKLQRWLQPGGHVEPEDGGDGEAAARREVREETGLFAIESGGLFDVDVHTIPARGDEPEHRHHDLRFLFFAGAESDSATGELQTRWFTADELLGLQPDAGMRRMIAKARERGVLR